MLPVLKEEPRAKDFRGSSLEISRDFFAKPTEVHPPCQPRTWHLSTNCMACVKTTFSHAIIQVAYGTSSSCWQQSMAAEQSVRNLVMPLYGIW